MERYLCIHAHFYQPPRENPWLGEIEIQDSAHPYHDWNERIAAECYVPNSASRLLDGDNRILDIVSNYSHISFNIGPTLLSWMEQRVPEAYAQILAADRQSREWRGGHGNALAQVYNHLIMPLANSRDKETQVLWGIEDFRHRFGRDPEGMWLAETAAEIETLDLLAQHGIRFTILAPSQAARTRRLKGGGRWRDVSNSRIDPSQPYLCRLPSGRTISLFFYDGPISQAVAFENMLGSGEHFADRLLGGFSEVRSGPQLMHIATDGESYGHHHRFGDMALAYALHSIEANGLATLTNYGEYLERFPPSQEVIIFENSSWSCIHGVERWKSDCGCNSGGHSGWSQEWRAPLRESLDWLRDAIAPLYEERLRSLGVDPWAARDAYVEVILDQSEEVALRFAATHSQREFGEEERTLFFRCLEMQRQTLLMYTSCGWFFDEISGIETVQIMQYAGRAIQLAQEMGLDLEAPFLERLAAARSNIPEHGDGARIYEKFVRPAMVNLEKVAAHYAISSLFEEYGEDTGIYHYDLHQEDFWQSRADMVEATVGRVAIRSRLFGETRRASFCVLHVGSHSINCRVRDYRGDESYQAMKEEVIASFGLGDYTQLVRVMDTHFGINTYSLLNLFRDEQRHILDILTEQTVEGFINRYREMYDRSRSLMQFLRHTHMPIPRVLVNAAEYVINHDLWNAIQAEPLDSQKMLEVLEEIHVWGVTVDSAKMELVVRQKLEMMMGRFAINPAEAGLMAEIRTVLKLLGQMDTEVNYWQVQNTYHSMAQTVTQGFSAAARAGDQEALHWLEGFRELGIELSFNIDSLAQRFGLELPGEGPVTG
jgi:alpha-amylase/alpha-mannosidase (GH57 family)